MQKAASSPYASHRPVSNAASMPNDNEPPPTMECPMRPCPCHAHDSMSPMPAQRADRPEQSRPAQFGVWPPFFASKPLCTQIATRGRVNEESSYGSRSSWPMSGSAGSGGTATCASRPSSERPKPPNTSARSPVRDSALQVGRTPTPPRPPPHQRPVRHAPRRHLLRTPASPKQPTHDQLGLDEGDRGTPRHASNNVTTPLLLIRSGRLSDVCMRRGLPGTVRPPLR